VEDFATSFEDRLASLARTQDLLVSNPSDSVTLGELVRLELSAHARDKQKAVVLGPLVDLPPRITQAMAMAIHELVTNAAKYGALSNEGGSIEVRWLTEQRDGKEYAVFRWRERGVPIQIAATKKGFGSQIIGIACLRARQPAQLTFHSMENASSSFRFLSIKIHRQWAEMSALLDGIGCWSSRTNFGSPGLGNDP
jgi:two-component sensor histidine kinase